MITVLWALAEVGGRWTRFYRLKAVPTFVLSTVRQQSSGAEQTTSAPYKNGVLLE